MSGEPVTKDIDPSTFQLPSSGPQSDAANNLAEWNTLAATSADRVGKTAEAWRTGLAGFVTLITGLLILKGPDTVADIAPGWNWIVLGLLVSGGAAATVGLWFALEAASPSRFVTSTYDEAMAKYGSIQGSNIATANTSVRQLGRAKRLVLVSLIFLGAGIVCWWTVPTAENATTVSIVIDTNGDHKPDVTLCGDLTDGPSGTIGVRQANGKAIYYPTGELLSLSTVSSCSK